MDTPRMHRRTFFAVTAALVASVATRNASGSSATTSFVDHPEPRPGITGAKVLTAEQLKDNPDVIRLFDGIREFAHIADGIRCSCGCAVLPSHRSLLTCYEEPAMATSCEVCIAQGELVVRRAREGQNLAQIRVAINARWYRNERSGE
jgi:hypothetical protein